VLPVSHLPSMTGEQGEYVSAFEVIRQLVRIQLPVLGPLKAIQARASLSKPASPSIIANFIKDGDDLLAANTLGSVILRLPSNYDQEICS